MLSPALSTADHLAHLFRYSHWATTRIIDALEASALGGSSDAASMKLLSHLLRAQDVWLGRLQGTDDVHLDLWAMDGLPACRARSTRSTQRWVRYLRACSPADLTAPAHYQNTKGATFRNQVREIAAHVVNHATHHRAQIAANLRAAGHTPPPTDYIFYARDPATNGRHPLHVLHRGP